MTVIFIRKTVRVLFMVLEGILRAAFIVLKLVLWILKLFLLLSMLSVSGVSSIVGVTSGRR